MVSCLYISYLLLIFEYKIRESSLIVLTSLCLNWCLNQRKIGRVRYKKICLYVAVNQFLMLPWRCTWKNVAHLLWEQRVAGSNPVTPTENETVTKVAVFLLSWFLGEMGGFRQPERQPEFSMNASVSVVCYKSKVLSNGKSPLMLRVTKDRKPKYVSLGIFSSILKNTGVNIALISQALGHQDIKTTEIYLSKFDDKQMDEAMSNLL